MKSTLFHGALRVAALPLFVSAGLASPAFADTALSPILVTAARMPQSAREVLSDNLIISAEEIATSGQRSLVDLLQQKRGFEISRYGGAGNTSSVFVRGAGNNQTVVLVDGVRIGSASLGGATWESIPLAQIDHVEVVFGPQSSLYGADAMGGVVQIFTRKGETAPQANVGAGVGSYGLRTLDAGLSGASKEWHYSLQAAREIATGFSATRPDAGPYSYNADRDGYGKTSASGQFGVVLAAGHELSAQLMHSRLNAQFDAGPGFDDRNILQLDTAALVAKNRLSEYWDSTMQVARSSDEGTTFASYGNDYIRTTQDQLSWQNDVRFGFDSLQFVIERRTEQVDAKIAALAQQRRTNSFAAAYHWRRDAQLANLAVRSDENSQFGTHTTGSLDYGYRVSDAWRVNGSVSSSFRAPTFSELYYPSYGIASNRPEQGRNAELGLYYGVGSRTMSAVVYRNRIRDLLVYAQTCPVEKASHPYGCAYNVDQAILQGLTMAASDSLGSFTLRATLDLQRPRDETTGRDLARRAKQHGTLAVEYAAGGVKSGAEVIFSGRRFDDAGNFSRMGGYGVFNMFASADLDAHWSVLARWNNVSGKVYDLAKNYTTPGSNVFAGVRYRM